MRGHYTNGDSGDLSEPLSHLTGIEIPPLRDFGKISQTHYVGAWKEKAGGEDRVTEKPLCR